MNSLLTFVVGDERYGVAIDQVQEVVRAPRLDPVPRAPSWLAGAINLHGSPRAVIDLPAFLGFPGGDRDPRLIALTPAASGLALAITRLESIVDCDLEAVLPRQEDDDSCVRGVLPQPERMINLLHLERLLQRLESKLGDKEWVR